MRRKFLFEYDMTFMTILSVVLFIIPSLVVYGYYLLTRGKALNVVDSFFIKVFSDDISTSKMVLVYVIFIVIMFLWMVLHEIIHGIFYVYKGANKKNITFGAALEKGVFYCRCGEYVYKETVMTSLLAPFLIIGVITLFIGMLIHSYLLMILSVINISGAAGDLAMFMFFLDQHDKNLRFIEFGDTLTFAIESYEDLSQKHNKGVVFKKEVFNENELPVNDNSKKISISAGSYVIVFIFILIIAILVSLAYFL